MAERSYVLKKLDALEALLSKRFQEKNQNISKHTQMIRQILDVGMKGKSGNTSWTVKRRLSDVLTGSGTTGAGIQKLRPSSGIVDGRAGIVNSDPAGKRARPMTEIPVKKCSRGDYRNRGGRSSGSKQEEKVLRADIAQNAEEASKVKKSNEMIFLEDCLIHLKEMFNDDTKDNDEKIPSPNKNIMETVRTVHNYLVDVAGKIGRLKCENQHMKMIISGLHTNTIGGEENNQQKGLKPPNDILELERNAKTLTQTFNELKTTVEKLQKEKDSLQSTLDGLSTEITNPIEGKTQEGVSSHLDQAESSPSIESPNQESCIQSSASGSTAKGSNDMNVHVSGDIKEEAKNADSEPQTKQLSTTDIKKLKNTKRGKHTEQMQPSVNSQQIRINTNNASSMLDDKTAVGKLQTEKNSLQSKIDGRSTEITNPSEGKTHDDVSSQLDQADSSTTEDSTNQDRFIQSSASASAVKSSIDVNDHLSGDSQEEANNPVSESQPKKTSMPEKRKPKDKRKDIHTEQMQPSENFEQPRKNSENASSVLEEKPMRVDLKTKTEHLEEMSRKHKHLSEQNSELVKQVDSLRSRLSELAEAKLTHDNASIADLSDPNRPTKLAEMYSELYSNQWTDALEELSKIYKKESEQTLICVLYDILKDGYYFCQEIRNNQKSKLAEIMFDPAKCTKKSEAVQKSEVSKIVSKHLSEAAKLSSTMASSNIAKDFVAKKQTEKMYRKIMEPCRTYIEECVKLCWHMQIQTPPVCVDLETAKGHSFLKGMYREYTAKGPNIAYVVWPALFLHDKGPMLLKGVAQGE